MGLRENLKRDPVSRLSLRKPLTVKPTTTVRDAIREMREHDLGCVIVVDRYQKPQGIFTEAMLRRMVPELQSVLDESIDRHMATTFPWVSENDPIETVVFAVEAKNIRFVVVCDDKGHVSGLTGQKGLMEYVAEHYPGEVMVQRVGLNPYPIQREGA